MARQAEMAAMVVLAEEDPEAVEAAAAEVTQIFGTSLTLLTALHDREVTSQDHFPYQTL